jgi:phenylalanyl-tRNA synthetase beta subunit
LLDAGVRIGEVIALIEKSDPLIVDVDMIDEYADPAFSGKQGITVRIVFQSPERTLNDEEVNRALESIAAGLIKAFSLIIR